MAEVIKTYKEFLTFNNAANAYIGSVGKEENKISKALQKVISKQLIPLGEIYTDELDTIELNNCLTDATTKAILLDGEGRRKFSVESQLKFRAEAKSLLKKEVVFHSRIPEGLDDDLINSLTPFQREAFSGIVIPIQPIED